MRAGILFDLDETLIDRRRSLTDYAQALAAEKQKQLRIAPEFFVDTFHRIDRNGHRPRPDFFDALSTELFVNVDSHALEEHFYTYAWIKPRLFPGVFDMLRDLKKQAMTIGLVTNGSVRSQKAKIDNSALVEMLDGSVISEAFGAKKPDSSIFHHMIDTLKLDPAKTWFVGDNPIADICGAKDVGLKAAWIERHTPWPADVPRCFDTQLTSIAEVTRLVVNGSQST